MQRPTSNQIRGRPALQDHPLQSAHHNSRNHAAHILGISRAYSSGDQRGVHWRDARDVCILLQKSILPSPFFQKSILPNFQVINLLKHIGIKMQIRQNEEAEEDVHNKGTRLNLRRSTKWSGGRGSTWERVQSRNYKCDKKIQDKIGWTEWEVTSFFFKLQVFNWAENLRQETIKFIEENRQNTLGHKSQQDPLWPTTYE